MKKLTILAILFLGVFMWSNTVSAYDTNYNAYAEFQMDEGKRLMEWTDEEIKEYYKETRGRVFVGWNVHFVNKNVPVKYCASILFSYYNDGTSAISHVYEEEYKSSSKRVTTVKGGCKVSGKASNKKLSGGLEASVEGSLSITEEYSSSKSFKLDIKIDPQTKVVMYIEGTGLITNGVATKYSFFIRCLNGCFEIFIITSQYPRLEKTRVR